MTNHDLFLDSDAIISDDGVYRYALFRGWEKEKGLCLFVMLNPSTADATENDPTIRRCIDFAKRWGYGGLAVVNVFALRSADPKALADHPDPVGPENYFHVVSHAEIADIVVAAWGSSAPKDSPIPGEMLSHLQAVQAKFDRPVFCLGQNRDGSPKHPLYIPRTAPLLEYTP